jgi:diguanylate cyclase (GGDEF)-like protein
MSEIEKLQDDLREQALRDSLTGLYNRRYLKESLAMEINRARRTKQPFSVVILDLDNLKAINDRHGHITGGDQALQTLARELQKMCRESDMICRYGGDELLVLMYDTTAVAALRRANEWLEEVRKTVLKSKSGEFSITFSAGVAEYLTGDINGESILIRADRALYYAKGNGRNRAECYFKDMDYT